MEDVLFYDWTQGNSVKESAGRTKKTSVSPITGSVEAMHRMHR